MAKVVIGLSGGVDSSVAAYLLKEQGHEVIGVFMKNWHDTQVTISDECPWEEDSADALIVAQKLEIPFQTIDYSEAYKDRIVDYMFDEYKSGRTPNPDVLCNREIKFDLFLDTAIGLGADFVATGHYVRSKEEDGVYSLLSGLDQNKDQSYFLCQLSQYQLSKSLFPIGALQKSEVRRIAKEQDLITADKRDSQGLCFIGKVKLPIFLQQQLDTKEGRVLELQSEDPIFDRRDWDSNIYEFNLANGKDVGKHQGAHYYTVGQRKGLGIGGMKEPLFVLGTDVTNNLIFVGQGENHKGLYRNALFVKNSDVHWVRDDLKMTIGEKRTYHLRIRYRQPLQLAEISCETEGLYVHFEKPQRGITPGQFAAWYTEGELIGSGVID